MKLQLTPAQKERFQSLLMKAADNEMSGNEPLEFDRFLDVYDECRREEQQVKKLQAMIQDMKFRSPAEEVWNNFWVDVQHRLESIGYH